MHTIKQKSIVLFLFTCLLTSCDDGDIIVTTFDFDSETQLQLCGKSATKVIYAFNDEPIESISLRFEDADFDGVFFDTIPNPPARAIELDLANRLIYRTYSAQISQGNYFCSEVPPSSPTVLEEYTSSSGGSVIFTTTVIKQDDNDGVDKELEDLNANGNFFDDDSDGDGFPNFIDADDDNDNSPTLIEIEGKETLPENYRDTDGDKVPNYLDEDDDGDGTISRYEDLNAFDNVDGDNVADLNPADDDTDQDGIPNYLDTDDSEPLTVDLFKKYEVSRTFRTRLTAKNVTMNHSTSDESITFETLIMGYLDISATDTLMVSSN